MATTNSPAVSIPSAHAKSERYPPEVFYVVGTEGAERFSFYGMTAILTLYMTRNLSFTDADAVSLFGVFNGIVYIAPLLGGWLSDAFIGRYKTILWVSLAYVIGHGVLAVWSGITGLYVGCFLIALGAGGIKPCVSAFMGDQFRPDQAHLLERAYGWFYFAINVGSIGGIFLVPVLFEKYGPHVAFAAPGVAMLIAWLIFIAGTRYYTKLPPTRAIPRPDLTPEKKARESKLAWTAAARIGGVFLFISVFWALFFQYGSSWVLQATKMDLNLFGFGMSAGHVSLLNSIFVLSLIPVMNGFYKRRAEAGREVTPLQKMMVGMYIGSFAFVAALLVQLVIDRGGQIHALWQAPQYLLLSLAEVMISITGLEFAYTQAPKTAKSVIMGVWFLCISLGAILSGLVAKGFSTVIGDPFDWKLFYGFFFVLMLVAAVLFTFVARRYRPVQFDSADASPAA